MDLLIIIGIIVSLIVIWIFFGAILDKRDKGESSTFEIVFFILFVGLAFLLPIFLYLIS